jgi:AP-4 complex subunit epsilon-1
MDIPYNKSGASSRAHYQLVRSVENAPEQTEQILAKEVERIRQRLSGKMLSTVLTSSLFAYNSHILSL